MSYNYTKLNLCDSSPCINSGICVELSIVSYKCWCRNGETGTHCEYIDACFGSPCLNGGVCNQLSMYSGAFNCTCTSNYIGIYCEELKTTNPSIYTTTTTKSLVTTTKLDSSETGNNSALIAGIAAGVGVAVLIAVFTVVLLLCKYNKIKNPLKAIESKKSSNYYTTETKQRQQLAPVPSTGGGYLEPLSINDGPRQQPSPVNVEQRNQQTGVYLEPVRANEIHEIGIEIEEDNYEAIGPIDTIPQANIPEPYYYIN